MVNVMNEGNEGNDAHQGILGQLANAEHSREALMRRPSSARLEGAGRWEVEVEQEADAISGVRIYLPNIFTASRAFYPYPVHLDTAQTQKLVMRWLNQTMDAHYSLCSLERIYWQKGYTTLTASIQALMQRFVSDYQELWVQLTTLKRSLMEECGVALWQEDMAQVRFTRSVDFVAALSTPEDRYVIRVVAILDQIVALFDRAYLTLDLSQERYMQGVMDACRMVETLLITHLSQAKTQVKTWLAEADRLASMGSI